MTYLQFHLIFILPPIFLLLFLNRRRLHRAHFVCLFAVCGIALIFTLPWDHAAVARRIWEFDDARILFRVWLLPIEEIAFFILETLAVGLLTILFLPVPDPKS